MKAKRKMIGAILAGIVSAGVSHAALVGEWNFDSQTLVNSGTAGAVHDGTFVTGSPVFSTDTVDGNGYSLQFLSIAEDDNTIGGDVLRIDNSSTVDGSSYMDTFDSASAFTYSMWVKSSDGSWFQWDEFGGKGNESGNDGWAMRARNFSIGTQVDFYQTGADTTARDSSPVVNVADQKWHLLTYTYDTDSTLMLYIDGLLEGTISNATMNVASTRALVFGAREDGSRGENVLMDGIRFYDDALSAAEVLELYSEPVRFFVDPSAIALELTAPATTITGSVAAVFTSSTDVEVSVTISDSAHPGAFSVLSATPQTLIEAYPSNTVFEFEFDNDIANLADGESATGVVSFVWNESGSATTQEVTVPMTVRSVAPPALVGEWNFDSQSLVNSGTAGSIHDGTFSTGTPDYSTDTPAGTGYSLRITSIGDNYDPGGDVLLINNSKTSEGGYLPTFDGDAFTVSMWMKTEDASWERWDEFGGKGHENPNAGWAVRSSNDDRIRLTAYGQGDAISAAEPLDQNWHLLTATYNAATATMAIYVDGESKAEETGVAITDASIYALAFGAREDGSRGENILLDEIQYYSGTLSDEEVAALYTSPVGLSVDPSEISLELIAPTTTVTGSVAVSYFASTDVDVSVSISDPAHPGAFSVLSVTPQTLTEPTPSNTVFEFEFDNSIANLLDGETATGVVTFVWNESGSTTTREVTVPMTVLYYASTWMTLVELGGGASAVNPLELSTEGSSDWVMLGRGGDSGSRDEHIGADYIGAVTVSGTHGSWYNSAYQSSWTNGSPLISTNNVKGNWEAGESFSFSVDGLDAGTYTLTMYCSKYRANGEMTATLGTDVITRSFDTDGSGASSRYGVYTMNVDIASPSDSLDVSYVLTAGTGNIGLTAITLSADHVLNPGVGDISIEIISGGTEVALSWDTPDGANSLYGVKATDRLTSGGSWVDIHTDVPGTGSEVTVTNALSAGPEFYRAYIQD